MAARSLQSSRPAPRLSSSQEVRIGLGARSRVHCSNSAAAIGPGRVGGLDGGSCAPRTLPLNGRVQSPDEHVIRVVSVRVAEAAVSSFAVATGSQGLDKRDEIGGVRWGDLDGRREMFKAVRSQGAGWAIPEDFENPG